MKKQFALAVAILGAALLLSELAARHALPRVPSCIDVTRNPYRFRGWPEYISWEPVPSSAGTVVLLTNSQGYAGELPARQTYPARLERLLTEGRLDGRSEWHVLNWATDGITVLDYTILASVLQRQAPSLVLVVTGYADYALEHADRGFLYCRSDISRLATRWPVARRLPASYWRRHGKVEDTATMLFRDRFALLRYREYAWSVAEALYPGIHQALYAPSVNYLPWAVKARARTMPLRKPPQATQEPRLTYGNASAAMLEDFLAQLAAVPTRVVVVSEPIRITPRDERWPWHERFAKDLETLTARYGLELWDLHDALPHESFITSSHLHPRNHQRFAALLMERLARMSEDHAL